MTWLFLAIGSAFCLGFYDVSKKRSLEENSVPFVLFLSVLFSSPLLSPFLLLSRFSPSVLADTLFFVPQVDGYTHCLIFLKSCIVLLSWGLVYWAVQHLPLTVVSPITATRPMWTLLGALFLFSERLNLWQWIGVSVAIAFFWLFSYVGKKEGFEYTRNKYIIILILGTLCGSASGLYDKYLMHSLDHAAVQVYYTFYQTILMGIICLVMLVHNRQKPHTKIRSAGWIVCISVFLILSDFLYFLALSYPDSLISVISLVRRSGVIIPFIYGAAVLHEKNLRWKVVCLSGVLLGMLCLFFGTLG